MRRVVLAAVCVSCLVTPGLAQAQSAPSEPSEPSAPSAPSAAPLLPAPSSQSFWAPFKAIPKDFTNFFSPETAKILGVTAAGVMVAHRWDDDGIAMALGRFKPIENFKPGNVTGSAFAQVGGAFAMYTLGKAMDAPRVAEVGGDLFRAQLLSQGIVQALKHTLHRTRPDGSNNLSMPSGHTAGTFATATVLQRHFGWKVGLPAYAMGGYVAAARMSANKHHLTDVMVGGAIGIAVGRTVTIGRGKNRFAVGVSPTDGGAAITFTKQ